MLQHPNDNNESAEPSQKKQKRSLLFETQEAEVQPSTYWPRDLISLTIPNARVLTYSYNTHEEHNLDSRENRHTIYDIAWNFLIALETERRTESSRPIYFIGHNFGGIIIKEMLRRSSNAAQNQIYLKDIFSSTIGVIFFGTLYNGADIYSILQRLVEKVIKTARFTVNQEVVNTFLPRTESLQELFEVFSFQAQQQQWIIHSFQEDLKIVLSDSQKVGTFRLLNRVINELHRLLTIYLLVLICQPLRL